MVINTNITPAQTNFSIAWIGAKSSKLRMGDADVATVDDGLTAKNIEPTQDVFHIKMNADGSSGNGSTATDYQRRNDAEALNDASSFTHAQQMYLANLNQALKKMEDLAVQAQDSTLSAEDRAKGKKQFADLVKTIVEVAGKDYNGVKLFDGNPRQLETLNIDLPGVNLAGDAYARAAQGSIDDAERAQQSQKDIGDALKQLAKDRQTVQSNVDNLTQAAENTISFTDIKEASAAFKQVHAVASEFVQNNEQAMMAQANVSPDPQRTLQLLH